MTIVLNPAMLGRAGYYLEEADKPTYFLSGTYLHGEAEVKSCLLGGYDLIGIVNQSPHQLTEGVHQAIILGIDEPATMFYWRSPSTGEYRGLVVLESDMPAMEYASKAFTDKKRNL
jgi:hypothetical protein